MLFSYAIEGFWGCGWWAEEWADGWADGRCVRHGWMVWWVILL